ncbi:MAG TPA: extracellular solute-binding protein [Candidatus Competibacter sp.]|nr:extracellular solute-binding protein [Candidatus Competibacter sp.]
MSALIISSWFGATVTASKNDGSGLLARALAGFLWLLCCPSPVFAQQSPGPHFIGVEITVGVQDVSAIGAPAKVHAQTWEQRTGGKVRVVSTPFGKLFDVFKASLTAPEPVYDVLLYPSAWAGDFFPYLAEVPSELIRSESFDDIHPTYRERLMAWNGKWIAMTVDGDLFQGYYRKDLFEDPANRKDFRERYNRELAPPGTWTEYRDIAEFFTGRRATDGTALYGAAEAFARGGQQFWDVFSRASAYTNHPAFRGAQFFDPDTMRAQINNPGWVRAVQDYVDILKFCSPDAKGYDIVGARQAFMSGHAAMILDWGDTGPLAEDPAQSHVVGKVGYFVLPGSRDVWNGRFWRWERFERPYKAPFLAFGGWVAGVPKNSRHQQAAWDYIQWYSSPENSLHDVVTSGTGINPYRLTHFTDIDAWTRVFSRAAAAEYLEVLRASLDSPQVALDLRIPGFFRYTEALEIQLTRALNGETPVKEALDKVAADWEAITDDLGRDQQLAIYRASMGLSPEPNRPHPQAVAERRRVVIGFSQATTTEPWRLLFNKELREEAAKYPQIELIVKDGMDKAEQQVADMEALIAQRVDAILISPKVAEALTPVVSKAFDVGIPVIVLDRDVLNDRYIQFIGGDNYEIGRAAGRYAVDLLGGPGRARGKVVEIWGGMASTPAQDRHGGFYEIVGREPGIQIVNQPKDGDWKQDRGYEIMAEALEKQPAIDLVYAHNDPMAHGAYQAAKDAGREKGIAFLGIDGIPAEGVKWVNDSVLTATFLYKTPGDEGIRQVLRFLRGENIPRRLTLPTLTIDRANAAEILRANGLL